MPETKAKKVNAFDVIKKLADDNNKGFAMAPLSNVIEVKQNGARCTFLIGVDAAAVKNYLLDKTKHGGLLLIDGEAFKAAEKELSEQPDASQQSRSTAIGFAEWLAESRWRIRPDMAEGEEQLWYWPSDDIDVPDEDATTNQLYDHYLNFIRTAPSNPSI